MKHIRKMNESKDEKYTMKEMEKLIDIFKEFYDNVKYNAEHIKSEPYDYGEGYQHAIYNIREDLEICENDVRRVKQKPDIDDFND